MEEVGIKIWDKDGNPIALVPVEAPAQFAARADSTSKRPTQVKWLNGVGTSYQSQEFSEKGTRFSGYSFNTKDKQKLMKITFKKGGFMIFACEDPNNPGNYVGSSNIPLNQSPFYAEANHYLYFGVDNPIKGQTYRIERVAKLP